jgi:hypothetical protein
LTAAAALTSPVAPGTSPTALTLGNNVQRIYYVAAADQDIHALDYDDGDGFNRTGALTVPKLVAERAQVRFRNNRKPLARLM